MFDGEEAADWTTFTVSVLTDVIQAIESTDYYPYIVSQKELWMRVSGIR